MQASSGSAFFPLVRLENGIRKTQGTALESLVGKESRTRLTLKAGNAGSGPDAA